jgi:molecular chaperone GrpE
MADDDQVISNDDGRAAEAGEPALPPETPAAGSAEAAGDQVAELRQALEAGQAKAAEYLDGWQRARADFANYKRRVEKEQAEAYQSATARVFTRFLDVYDDFDRAVLERPAEGAEAAAWAQWANGIELIQRKLQAILDTEGVKRMDAAGQPFDPLRHEAITHEDNADNESGHIIGVVRHGYTIGDRVLRPALVRVAK